MLAGGSAQRAHACWALSPPTRPPAHPPTHLPPAQTLVKSLILLRNRQQLSPTQLLPLLFRLFRVQDKALRQLVFRHITADIKAGNKKGRNDKPNRAVQNFMYRWVGSGGWEEGPGGVDYVELRQAGNWRLRGQMLACTFCAVCHAPLPHP